MSTTWLIAALLGSPAPADNMTVLSGGCTYPIEIGKPAPQEHRFSCRSVVISQGSGPSDVLIQFAGGANEQPIGFAGDVVDDTVSVRRIYVRPGVRVEATSGHCRLFFKGEDISGVSCVGRTAGQTYVANFVAG